MRKNLLFLILLAALPLYAAPVAMPIASSSTIPAVSLADCYQKARQLNETISISAENVKLIEAQYRAEVGTVLPHVDWIRSQFWQQNTQAAGANGASGSSLLAVQPLSYFQLTQPIFAGFRDWAAVGILKSQKEQARLNQTQTDLQLLSDVSAAFYLAYTLQDQLSVLQTTLKLNQDQVNQLDHWVDIGRSRPSEVLSAQTQLASLQAQTEQTKGSLEEARHLLLFLTGVPGNVPLRESPPSAPALSEEEALTRAWNRPDLLSAQEALHQTDLGLRYARGGHYPIVGVVGRYYTERVGFLQDIDWDLSLNLDVPIFEGGSTQAQVNQARSQQIIAQLTLGRMKRDVERQVRTAYDDLRHSASVYSAYQKAVELAQKDYDVQQKEYRQGSITNLDLLRLLTDMQNVQGQWLAARANAGLDEIRLRIAMGEGL